MRNLIWLILLGALVWAVRELTGRTKPARKAPAGDGEEMVRDPQCGVYLPVTDAMKKRVGGETVYFCSKECEGKYNGKSGV